MLILQQLILLLLIQLYVLINQDFRLDSQVVNGSKLLTCPERFLGSNPSLGAKTHGVLSLLVRELDCHSSKTKGSSPLYSANNGEDLAFNQAVVRGSGGDPRVCLIAQCIIRIWSRQFARLMPYSPLFKLQQHSGSAALL